MEMRGDFPVQPEYRDEIYARIASGHLAHALLFLGASGSGKKVLARETAAALMCDRHGAPCGTCPGCRLYQSGNHPELITIEPDNGMIRIGQIRQMQQQIYVKPVQADRWAVLILDADRMNPQAQNALLKTLEEPPQATLMLTASSLARLLPTIRSRCQIFRMPPLSMPQIAAYVARQTGKNHTEALLYARMGTSPGAALALANWPEYPAVRSQVLGLCAGAAMGDVPKVLAADSVLGGVKDHMDSVLDIILSWTRDLRVYGATQRLDWIVNQEYADTIRAVCGRLDETTIHWQERYLRRTLRMIRENAHPVLAVTDFLLAVAKGESL